MKTPNDKSVHWLLSSALVAGTSLLLLVATLGMVSNATFDGDGEVDNELQPMVADAMLPSLNPDDPHTYGDMVRMPTGTFIMGLTDEDVHDREQAGRVVLAMGQYYIDRFEVTNREYLDFVLDEKDRNLLPDADAWGGDEDARDSYLTQSQFEDYPVIGVTWENARAFCESELNGNRRLPTEAEWEYAARAGQVGAVYPWRGFRATDDRGRYLANFSPEGNPAATGYSNVAPVGAFPPNRWGIHDMAGNAAEWVEDAYSSTYDHYDNEAEPTAFHDESQDERVVRGGSWSSNSFDIGVGVRDSHHKDRGSREIGFRCAADLTVVEGDTGTDLALPPAADDPDEEEDDE